MRKLLYILILGPLVSHSQLFIGESALVHVTEGANLEVGGDLENAGAIQNLGTISLYGDWTINNNFNGLEGALNFLGGGDQSIEPPQLTVSELTINQGGEVSFPGNEYVVTDRIDFDFGNIVIGENTRFILGENITVSGGSNDSYFDGTLISRGIGFRQFPLGSNGVHAPITLLNVQGVDTEIAARFQSVNPGTPIPGDSLLGVSHRGLWEVELVNGGTDPFKVEVDFNQEDLSDFRVRNNIRHKVNSPVLAVSNSPEGEFRSLGVQRLLDTDSLTFGTLESERVISTPLGEKVYLAVALAPRIPNEGLFFVPEAFSPNASDPLNQTFRIFGENIVDEDFSLEVYNRLGILVYSTTSFVEANENGWNGNNQNTGASEPTGIYFYSVRVKFNTDLVQEKEGAFYLVK